MNKLKFTTIFLACLTITLFNGVETAAQSVNLSTYLPPPTGTYERVRLIPHSSVPGNGSCITGTLYTNTSGYVQYCDETQTWISIDSIWEAGTNGSDETIVFLEETDPDLKVGIGTSDPQSTLHIKTNTGSGTNNALNLKISNTTTNGSAQIGFAEDSSTSPEYAIRYHSDNSGSIKGLAFLKPETPDDNIHLFFKRDETKLGVHTDDPQTPLHIHGSFHLTGDSGSVLSPPGFTGAPVMLYGLEKQTFVVGTPQPAAGWQLPHRSILIGQGHNFSSDWGFGTFAFGHGPHITGDHSVGFALDDMTSTEVSADNVISFLGGQFHGFGLTDPDTYFHIYDEIDADTLYAEFRMHNTINNDDTTLSFGEGTEIDAIHMRYDGANDLFEIRGYDSISGSGTDRSILTIDSRWTPLMERIEGVGIGLPYATLPRAKLEIANESTENFLQLYDDSQLVFSLQDGGNLGIGPDINPTQTLHVKDGAISLHDTDDTDSDYARLRLEPNSTSDFLLYNDTNNIFNIISLDGGLVNHLTIHRNGSSDVRIGINNSSPTYVFDADGDMNTRSSCYLANGSPVVGSCASDERLKSDIKPIENALEKINALNPVSYQFHDDYYGPGTQYGLIAQETEKIFPDLVSTDETGIKKVEYGLGIQMHIHQAIKELDEKLSTYEQNATENLKSLQQDIDSIKNNL